MAECKVFKCKCESEFQDKVYGKGFRVFNPLDEGKNGYKCTVCGAEIKHG